LYFFFFKTQVEKKMFPTESIELLFTDKEEEDDESEDVVCNICRLHTGSRWHLYGTDFDVCMSCWADLPAPIQNLEFEHVFVPQPSYLTAFVEEENEESSQANSTRIASSSASEVPVLPG
jgi:hypothetical protein